jgi:hypothetical protein
MMLWLKSYHLYLTLAGYCLILSEAKAQKSEEIRCTQPATIPFDWDSQPKISRTFTDTLTGDIIYQARTSDSIPLFYAKDIFTSVCFDNQCRQLNITVYWNITGRYLGFKLPEKEFLSRQDHEPFNNEDYQQLNALLADPYLPLAKVSFDELIEQSHGENTGVDGVSGATSRDVLDYVVKGAAYTTFTLWNIIHGPSKVLVRNLAEQEITPSLLALTLKSPSSEDRIWGLDNIDAFKELDEQVTDALLQNISGVNFFVAYSAINVITPIHLKSEPLQIQLFSIYEKVNYNLRRLIIEKLWEAPAISQEVIDMSRDVLKELNGEQLGYLLELYHQHAVEDTKTRKAVAKLLYSDNRFISQKAYSYLIHVQENDKDIVHELKKYEQTEKQ